MNYSKILTIKDVEEDEQADNDNYILIITEGLITLISRNQLQHSFFLSDVESPVFALHERDDKHPISWGAFLLQNTATACRADDAQYLVNEEREVSFVSPNQKNEDKHVLNSEGKYEK